MNEEKNVEAVVQRIISENERLPVDHKTRYPGYVELLAREVIRQAQLIKVLEEALDWYDDHKSRDGSYDGSTYGEIRDRFDIVDKQAQLIRALELAGISHLPIPSPEPAKPTGRAE